MENTSTNAVLEIEKLIADIATLEAARAFAAGSADRNAHFPCRIVCGTHKDLHDNLFRYTVGIYKADLTKVAEDARALLSSSELVHVALIPRINFRSFWGTDSKNGRPGLKNAGMAMKSLLDDTAFARKYAANQSANIEAQRKAA